MIVLGASLTMDAGAVLVRDGVVLGAVNEERLIRIKQVAGVPRRSMATLLRTFDLAWDDVDVLATTELDPGDERRLARCREIHDRILAADLDPTVRAEQVTALWRRYGKERSVTEVRAPSLLAELAALGPPLAVYDHHDAHAIAALDFAGALDGACYMTADGWGGARSTTVGRLVEGALRPLSESSSLGSLGYVYGAVTKLLGYVPHRHEGKVLGLAAHGNPTETAPVLRRAIGYDRSSRQIIGRWESGLYRSHYDNPGLAEALADHRPVDVAAGVQVVLEECITGMLDDVLDEPVDLYVAGGVFANVLLNQSVAAHPYVRSFHVVPHMGDGGLALGAAALACREAGTRVRPPDHVFLGPDIGPVAPLPATVVPWSSVVTADQVADILAAGHPVAVARGAMEWGPRALGHRSILADPRHPGMARALNQALHRTETMPFAPIATVEAAPELFDLGSAGDNTRYMTITVPCTPAMRELAPACVHVDGTARPQVVDARDDPFVHEVLVGFARRTGVPAVVNTSFNRHEEPIVADAADAVSAVRDAGLRFLVLGDCLLENTASSWSPLVLPPARRGCLTEPTT
jgi:carbamoyltransferase